MDKTEIVRMLEKVLEEARGLGADTRELEDRLQGLRDYLEKAEARMER